MCGAQQAGVWAATESAWEMCHEGELVAGRCATVGRRATAARAGGRAARAPFPCLSPAPSALPRRPTAQLGRAGQVGPAPAAGHVGSRLAAAAPVACRQSRAAPQSRPCHSLPVARACRNHSLRAVPAAQSLGADCTCCGLRDHPLLCPLGRRSSTLGARAAGKKRCRGLGAGPEKGRGAFGKPRNAPPLSGAYAPIPSIFCAATGQRSSEFTCKHP